MSIDIITKKKFTSLVIFKIICKDTRVRVAKPKIKVN